MGFTVNKNVLLSGPPVRFTVTVIFVVPFPFVAGLMVTIPVDPTIATLKCAESFGTTVGSLRSPSRK